MEFEWDEEKSLSNFEKHAVPFDEAKTVFTDAVAVSFYDESHSKSEDRFIRIGRSLTLRILVVVYCMRADSRIRIISARRATAEERWGYEKKL